MEDGLAHVLAPAQTSKDEQVALLTSIKNPAII